MVRKIILILSDGIPLVCLLYVTLLSMNFDASQRGRESSPKRSAEPLDLTKIPLYKRTRNLEGFSD